MVWLNVTVFYIDLSIIFFLAIFPVIVFLVHRYCKHDMRYNRLLMVPGPVLGIHLIYRDLLAQQ
jgi:hypothetical protein